MRLTALDLHTPSTHGGEAMPAAADKTKTRPRALSTATTISITENGAQDGAEMNANRQICAWRSEVGSSITLSAYALFGPPGIGSTDHHANGPAGEGYHTRAALVCDTRYLHVGTDGDR
jgi:hypothetical protein